MREFVPQVIDGRTLRHRGRTDSHDAELINVFGGHAEIVDRHRRDVGRQPFDEGPHAHAGVVHLRQLFVREGSQGRIDRGDLVGGEGRGDPCQHAGD
jgi:hypothetical protein